MEIPKELSRAVNADADSQRIQLAELFRLVPPNAECRCKQAHNAAF